MMANTPFGDNMLLAGSGADALDGLERNDQLPGLAEPKHPTSTPAFTRALGLARIEGAIDAFDASGTAVILVDRAGKVLRLNQVAERVIGDDLRIVDGRLVSVDDSATLSLNRTFRELI